MHRCRVLSWGCWRQASLVKDEMPTAKQGTAAMFMGAEGLVGLVLTFGILWPLM
jgi:hypothetical protein